MICLVLYVAIFRMGHELARFWEQFFIAIDDIMGKLHLCDILEAEY